MLVANGHTKRIPASYIHNNVNESVINCFIWLVKIYDRTLSSLVLIHVHIVSTSQGQTFDSYLNYWMPSKSTQT